jgi:glycine/D-amino acid oxidase-like deaminating enzyme
MSLEENVIVNCTGLGARDLFGDGELTPVKGQLVVLVPQPEVDYSMGGMMPRSDGIVLGHVQQRGVWSMEVDEVERTRVMENAIATFAQIRPPRAQAEPSRFSMASVPPLESFLGLES